MCAEERLLKKIMTAHYGLKRTLKIAITLHTLDTYANGAVQTLNDL